MVSRPAGWMVNLEPEVGEGRETGLHFKKLDILSIDFDWILNLRQQVELLSFLIPKINNHKNITMSLSHDKIYPLFTHDINEFNLFNVDHHHDFYYDKSKLNVLNEGNWLYHLSRIFKKRINYIWINNTNSDMSIDLREMENLKSYRFDYQLSFIKQKTFDKIFLCCSPDYAMSHEAVASYKIIESIVKS